MGLQWSKEKKLKENTLLVVNANMPPAKSAESEELWNLFRVHKEKIKQDGFSMKLNTYKGNNNWQVNYWHTIDANSFEKNDEGKCLWQVEFERKCAKWKKMLIKLRELSAAAEEDLMDNPPDTSASQGDDMDNLTDDLDQVSLTPAKPAAKSSKPSAKPAAKAGARPAKPAAASSAPAPKGARKPAPVVIEASQEDFEDAVDFNDIETD
jgi:hypothetical protein